MQFCSGKWRLCHVRALAQTGPAATQFGVPQGRQDGGFGDQRGRSRLAEFSLGGVAFLLQDFHNREMQENLMMFVAIDDLDAWWQHVQVSGVLQRYEEVRAKPPTVYPWGQREVHLIDPAGVCWHFG